MFSFEQRDDVFGVILSISNRFSQIYTFFVMRRACALWDQLMDIYFASGVSEAFLKRMCPPGSVRDPIAVPVDWSDSDDSFEDSVGHTAVQDHFEVRAVQMKSSPKKKKKNFDLNSNNGVQRKINFDK